MRDDARRTGRPALLAVSHGTADIGGARAIAALVAAVRVALPDTEVIEAFVDVQQPDALELAPQIDGPLVIVPLLLSSGFHVHHDLHGISKTRPNTVVAEPMGPDERLAEVLAQRLPEGANPVILAVAGSRDPRSVTDAEDMGSLLEKRLGRNVHLAYLAARQPDLPTALAEHPDAVVSTYLLAEGFFFDLARRQAHARAISMPLLDGATVPRALVELVVARYTAAAARF